MLFWGCSGCAGWIFSSGVVQVVQEWCSVCKVGVYGPAAPAAAPVRLPLAASGWLRPAPAGATPAPHAPATQWFVSFSAAPHPLQWSPSSLPSCAGGSRLSWRCRDRAAPGTALSHWSGCWRSRQRITRRGWWWATQASCVLHAVCMQWAGGSQCGGRFEFLKCKGQPLSADPEKTDWPTGRALQSA